MRAYKCDRCHVLFETSEPLDNLKLCNNDFKKYDLCPTCTNDLKSWWDREEKAKDLASYNRCPFSPYVMCMSVSCHKCEHYRKEGEEK